MTPHLHHVFHHVFYHVFQFQELEWVEYNDVDSEGLIIPEVSSTKPGTSAIESFCYQIGGGRGK